MTSRLFIVALTTIAVSNSALAQQAVVPKPYSFSGTCSSQGLWTQEALQTTESIRNITIQLRDDANCKALGQKMQMALGQVENLVKPQAAESYSLRLTQLPQEIAAARQFAVEDSSLKAPLQNLMLKDQIELATRVASVQSEGSGVLTQAATIAGDALGGPVAGAAAGAAASQAQAMGERFAQSSRAGLQIFNQVIDSVPQMEECLTGNKAAGGQLLAGTVKLLTAFAASNTDNTGSDLATAISKFADMARAHQFAKVLRLNNQADFLASMSCLVEMTSENYCTTRDSQLLYNEMMAELAKRPREEEQKRVGNANPLAGYYILSQNLPMISSWIQRVQIGVEPRLPTDAMFQNKIFDEVNSFYKQIKTIKGNLGYDIEAMKGIQDENGRKNQARIIISKLASLLGDVGYSGDGGGDKRNFFMLGGSANELPFKLMGMKEMPAEVKGANGFSMDPDKWLQNNYSTYPAFNDPNALIVRVQQQLEAMIETASRNAVAYYNKFFIIDKLSLVNDSFLGTNYSVYKSLILVNDYLGAVEERLRASEDTRSMVPALQDTRTRIQNVLDAYQGLKELSESLSQNNSKLSKEEVDRIAEANLKIVTAVSEEFQVMLGKSGWFANRVVKFVYADYISQIRGKQDFGSSINDLFYASGLSIFDQLVASANGNPAVVQNGLSLALRLNKMNLDSVEMLMKDYFAATTANMKAVTKASREQSVNLDRKKIQINIWDRVLREQKEVLPGTDESHGGRIVKAIFWALWEQAANVPSIIPYGDYSLASSRYSYRYENLQGDDEFGSASRLRDQLCIQSLAFQDVRAFYSLCKGVVLKSPFLDSMLTGLDAKQRSELSVSYDQKLMESKMNVALNTSKRICAFRDYNRKNLVVYLTQGNH